MSDNGSGSETTETTDLTTHRAVLTHRGLIRQALTVFKRECEKTKKNEDAIGNDTSETEEKIAACDHLHALLTDQRDLLLDGTPMGDAMTAQHFRDDDGQSLTVDAVGELLEAAGATEWAGEIVSQWTLEQRKEVARWARAAHRAQTDDKVSVPARPALVPDEWLSDALLKAEQEFHERNPMLTEDVEQWINAGPWGVRSYPSSNPSASEWEIVKVDRETGQVTDTFSRVYDDLDQARERAAWFNKQAAEAQFDAALTEAGLVDRDGLIVDESDDSVGSAPEVESSPLPEGSGDSETSGESAPTRSRSKSKRTSKRSKPEESTESSPDSTTSDGNGAIGEPVPTSLVDGETDSAA